MMTWLPQLEPLADETVLIKFTALRPMRQKRLTILSIEQMSKRVKFFNGFDSFELAICDGVEC